MTFPRLRLIVALALALPPLPARALDLESLKAKADAPFDGSAPAPAGIPLQVGASARVITPATDGKPWGEPFVPSDKSGRYVIGDRCADENHNGRCDQLFFAGYQRLEKPSKNWHKWLVRGLRRDPRTYNTPDGFRDDLYARALVIKGGGKKIGFVTVDAVGLLYPEAEKIRARVADLGFDLVVVQATHNHEGPDTVGLWGPLRTPPLPVGLFEMLFGGNPFHAVDGKHAEFMERLRDQAAAALRDADGRAEDATLGFGEAPVPPYEGKPLQHDNRFPEVFDNSVHALQARDAFGDPIATLVNFGIHPEILGSNITKMSADISGAICDDVQQQGGGIGLHANGAIGGLIGPNDLFGYDAKDAKMKPDQEQAFREKGLGIIGDSVARTALQSLASALPASISKIGVLKRRVFIPMDNKLLDMASRKGLFDRPRFTAGRPDPAGQDLETEIDLVVFHGPKGEPLAEIFTVPGELTPEHYLGGFIPAAQAVNPAAPTPPVLKDFLRAPHQYLLGLGNDELGYILPLNDFLFPKGLHPALPSKDRFGRPHYEETVSASSQLSQIVSWNLVGMLEEYYKGRTDLTTEAVALRSRRASLAALTDQKGAADSMLRLYLHQPVDAVTPEIHAALLKQDPVRVLQATAASSPNDPYERHLLTGLRKELPGF